MNGGETIALTVRQRMLRCSERLEEWTGWFPFGRAVLLLLLLALAAGGYLLLHPPERPRAGLRMWVFANSHLLNYSDLIPSYEASHPGVTVDLQLVQMNAVTYRLRAALWSDLEAPDLVEVEISRAGSFFQGPPEEVGFVDLTPYLERKAPDGRPWREKIVASRLKPYSVFRDGREYIFGLPHDVHPVMLAYRWDILEAELERLRKLDAATFGRFRSPEDLATWDDFHLVGLGVTREVQDERGKRMQYMMEFSEEDSRSFEVLLHQAGGGLFDARGAVTFDSECAVQVLLRLVRMLAGPKRIAKDLGWPNWARAVGDQAYLCWVAPDWRSKGAEYEIPQVSGKMKLMPLPAFEPGGRRTSTWGGTMAGITRRCQREGRADQAWELVTHLYFDRQFFAQRFLNSHILPPIKDLWNDPVMDQPSAYYSGQKVGRMYLDLAEQTPPQYSSPFVELAKDKAGQAVGKCVKFYRDSPATGPKELEEFARRTLAESAEDVRRRLNRDPFRGAP
jgi:arabinosaccharide transport system substrate-binding protein